MTIQDIMNQLRNMKADFVNGNINSEELVEEMEDLIRIVTGKQPFFPN